MLSLLFLVIFVDDEEDFEVKVFVVLDFVRCLVKMLKNYFLYLNFVLDVLF